MVDKTHSKRISIHELHQLLLTKKIRRRDYEFLACLECIIQALKHGNLTPADELISWVKQFDRRKKLIGVLENHGQLGFMTSERKFKIFRRPAIVQVDESRIESNLRRDEFFKEKVNAASNATGRSLHDRSTKRTTVRATKYAKQRPETPK